MRGRSTSQVCSQPHEVPFTSWQSHIPAKAFSSPFWCRNLTQTLRSLFCDLCSWFLKFCQLWWSLASTPSTRRTPIHADGKYRPLVLNTAPAYWVGIWWKLVSENNMPDSGSMWAERSFFINSTGTHDWGRAQHPTGSEGLSMEDWVSILRHRPWP
jgi:hypothetical protein